MFVTGVTVVLCGDKKSVDGATIAWATQVEADHLVLSMPKEAAVTEAILSGQTFSVSLLNQEQSDVARQYGGRGQSRPMLVNAKDLDVDKWAVPVVKNATATALCDVSQTTEVGDQTLIIAEITEVDLDENSVPLIYDHSDYFE